MKNKKEHHQEGFSESGEPLGPKSETEARLEAELAERVEEAEKLKKELLYQTAEVENFKRRTENRYRDMLKYATEPLVRDLLPAIDNLERALSHSSESSALTEGLGHVLIQFREVLAKNGVVEIMADGEKFDPNFHEAIAQAPGPEDGKVIMVQEKGYTIHGKLLRPARVVVSKLAQ